MQSNFGNWLKKRLRERGLKQKDLAEMLDVSDTAVSHYISGQFAPTIPSLVRICDALELDNITEAAHMICLDEISKLAA